MTWHADSVHAVTFFNPVGAPDALQPWLRMFRDPPSSFNSNGPNMPPGATASGLIGAYQVTISANVGRLEVALSPPGTQNERPQGIVKVHEALDVLKGYAGQLLDVISPVRLAIVANLARRADSAAQAAQALRQDLPPLNLVPEDATDLQLALNIRKDFANLGSEQNRLCRWSTGVQQIYTMQMTVGAAEPSLALQEFHAEVWSVDVNTGAPSGATSNLTPASFAALADEASTIIRNGYEYLVA